MSEEAQTMETMEDFSAQGQNSDPAEFGDFAKYVHEKYKANIRTVNAKVCE